ncbi:MAG: DUF2007 domain-containing protein [Pirellulales bacterium]|nr:DUF2007 domain-containing protein [Pirellulales bacterium]
MSDRQMVIYAARTSQDAHMLRNLLTEAGIRAVVVNDLLEQGSGVDIVGWPTLARVVVSEDDAPQARQIAMKHDRRGAAAAAEGRVEQPEAEVAPAASRPWPECPECQARRLTKCPICGTAGTNFAPVDMGFVWVPDADFAAAGASCGCGPDGCTPGAETAATADAEPSPDEHEADPLHAMLMCPTCDEPFAPEYPRVCEWCGHEFEDGFEVGSVESPAEQIDSRVIAVIVVLLMLTVALAGYFFLIL